VTFAFDAHDARAHLVDFLLAVVRAVVAARDDVLALGLRPHRERQHARRVGMLGNVLQQELDLFTGRQLLLLEKRAQSLVDLLAIGFRHVDVGQHLVDRVALLQAQRELVAIGRRRLGLAVGFRRLHREAPEIGRQALEVGRRDRRRRLGLGQLNRNRRRGRCRDRQFCWRRQGGDLGIRPVRQHQPAQGQADDADGKKDRPEQRKSQAFGGSRPVRRRRGIRHDH
jgi:hypothetical protein